MCESLGNNRLQNEIEKSYDINSVRSIEKLIKNDKKESIRKSSTECKTKVASLGNFLTTPEVVRKKSSKIDKNIQSNDTNNLNSTNRRKSTNLSNIIESDMSENSKITNGNIRDSVIVNNSNHVKKPIRNKSFSLACKVAMSKNRDSMEESLTRNVAPIPLLPVKVIETFNSNRNKRMSFLRKSQSIEINLIPATTPKDNPLTSQLQDEFRKYHSMNNKKSPLDRKPPYEYYVNNTTESNVDEIPNGKNDNLNIQTYQSNNSFSTYITPLMPQNNS